MLYKIMPLCLIVVSLHCMDNPHSQTRPPKQDEPMPFVPVLVDGQKEEVLTPQQEQMLQALREKDTNRIMQLLPWVDIRSLGKLSDEETKEFNKVIFLSAAMNGNIPLLSDCLRIGVPADSRVVYVNARWSALMIAIDNQLGSISYGQDPRTMDQAIYKLNQTVILLLNSGVSISFHDLLVLRVFMAQFIAKHNVALGLINVLLTAACQHYLRAHMAENELAPLLARTTDRESHVLVLNRPEVIALVWDRESPLWRQLSFPKSDHITTIGTFLHAIGMSVHLPDTHGRTILWHLVFQSFNPGNYERPQVLEGCKTLIEALVLVAKVTANITDDQGVSIAMLTQNPAMPIDIHRCTRAHIEEIQTKIIEILKGAV